MTDPIFDGDDDGNTPLSPEEREGLKPGWITTRGDLNRAEFDNIAAALPWIAKVADILDFDTLIALHRRMYGRVWRWAGTFRATGKNIGVDPVRIGMDLHTLIAEARYWIENDTWSADELMVRFHHRLVLIHPFPNGNGRHARMAADALAKRLDVQPLTWGRQSLVTAGQTRDQYIAALRAADRHDIEPLLAFARS